MIAFIPYKGEYLGIRDEPDGQKQGDTDQKGVRFGGSVQGINTNDRTVLTLGAYFGGVTRKSGGIEVEQRLQWS